jgi:hypothetical protein
MARNTNRDDFSPATRRAIERQARSHCSNPACRRLTSGASVDGTAEINIGQAAHICAAAPLGPRYDENMTSEQRSSADNGIWLCNDHARAVDSKDSTFTVELLREWKRQTNRDSWLSILHNIPFGPGMQAMTPDAMRERLRAAASADLAFFRNSAKWPRTGVALVLKLAHVHEPMDTRALARAVSSFDDLVLVAPPGMGKTTTLFQIAEGVLETANGAPLTVLLGDWATGPDTLLDSILRRPAFSGVTAGDFRAAAARPGVVLLLDGWNELDAAARERARVQITSLKAELPELGMVVSTRRQALDVPFHGTRVDLAPLGEEQQMRIARAMRGEAGARLLDQAWRTPGVRDLVTIPLYLVALLALPDGAPFPTTKEEVLQRFVAAQEGEPRHAAALHAATGGFQGSYLTDLAVTATGTGNTSIADAGARKAVSGTTQRLVADGQLAFAPAQPDHILGSLVSHHVLMRAGEVPGYAFQHQQFQEWYASHEVEDLARRAVADAAARERLAFEVLDRRPWTEAVLFAVERLSRSDAAGKEACASTILAAFGVDPMLAAEMIHRAAEDVWASVAAQILDLVGRWHAPGMVDRAASFMIASGRPEFADRIWPLVSNPERHVRLVALRSAGVFRPSVLGSEVHARIASLPLDARKSALYEIASSGGMDGLDLSTALAMDAAEPELKAHVIDALSFRRADRHIVDLLGSADDLTFDLIARSGHLDDFADPRVQERLAKARERLHLREMPLDRLRALAAMKDASGREAEIAQLVATMDAAGDNHGRAVLHDVRQRWPQALSEGLLRRVRAGDELFYGADDILAAARMSIDDESLLDLALGVSTGRDYRADAAASVLGPQSVGRLIDACLAVQSQRRDAAGVRDQAAEDRYIALFRRISRAPGSSLVQAVQARSAGATTAEIVELAGLLSRDTSSGDERARPFNDEDKAIMVAMTLEWGERVLGDECASRYQKSAIAKLASRAPSVALLPLLQRLLDDNLKRYTAFRQAALASDRRDQRLMQEAQHPHMHEYVRAFLAIDAPETDALMTGYLTHEHFGEEAAHVLAAHWTAHNESRRDQPFLGGVDFSSVEARRAARRHDPNRSSAEADHMFAAIDQLLVDGHSDEARRLAVKLGIIGLRLPHGQRAQVVERLLEAAPRQAKASLLLSLVLSGEDVDIARIEDGIARTFEAARTEPWILQDGEAYQLREWLRLLPFSTPVSRLPAIVASLPDRQRTPAFLEEMPRGLRITSAEDAESVLFRLAADDERFYGDREWRTSVIQLGTASAARQLIDLTVAGKIVHDRGDDWHWRRQLAMLMSQYPTLRSYARQLLKDGPDTAGLLLLAHALGEAPTHEDVLLLVRCEIATGRSLLSWHDTRAAVTEEVPSADWMGAFTIVPVDAAELRRSLLALVTSGDAKDPAAQCLCAVDKIRDEYGAPESEPRHPDVRSGRPWPVMAPDSDPDLPA